MSRFQFLGIILLFLITLSLGNVWINNEGSVIRIAIFQMAPLEGDFTANHATIEGAIRAAAKRGADWFITPELAESGYEFVDHLSPEELPEFPSPWFRHLTDIARDEGITLFIGFPERDQNRYYNAVAVIDQSGTITGVHQKMDIIPSIYEKWASPGTAVPLNADGYRIGYYICADAANQNITRAYRADQVDVMLSSAAWYEDPDMGPEQFWENATQSSRVPLIIANTVGKKGKIDFNHSKSGIYQDGKNIYTVQRSDPALAFVDWNTRTETIRPVGEIGIP